MVDGMRLVQFGWWRANLPDGVISVDEIAQNRVGGEGINGFALLCPCVGAHVADFSYPIDVRGAKWADIALLCAGCGGAWVSVGAMELG